jgi:hypothetical protein
MQRLQLTGKRFGQLRVLRFARMDYRGHSIWLCKCDCGTVKESPGRCLVSGGSTSCGCVSRRSSLRPLIGNFRIDDATGCWNWIGSKNTDGYAIIQRRKGSRVIASLYLGLDINDGKTHALHRCDNPNCINPKHIFLGTHLQNMQDMARKGRGNSGYRGVTHCKRGHEFTPENTHYEGTGRRCRTCHRLAERARRLRLATS